LQAVSAHEHPHDGASNSSRAAAIPGNDLSLVSSKPAPTSWLQVRFDTLPAFWINGRAA